MNVGDYVRTKDGYIYKIEDGEEFYEDYVNVGIGTILDIDGIWVDKEHFQYVDKREIVKSSPNIIDLIEVGDFIGKTIVEEVKEFDDGTRIIVMADGFDEYDENEYFLEAGIVTKEQFESMEYKVGGYNVSVTN